MTVSRPGIVPFEFSNRQNIVKVKSLKLGHTCLFVCLFVHIMPGVLTMLLSYEVCILLSLKEKKNYGIVKLPAAMCCIVFFELLEIFHCP